MVENRKGHLEPLPKRHHTILSREIIIVARSQEVNSSDKGVMVEVSSNLESSVYSESIEYSPLSKIQQGDDMEITSGEEDGLIDIKAIS